MAYEALIQYIESIVKANGNEEITGTNMQAVLEQIVAVVGSAQFRGVASPATDPGIPVGPAIYISATAGEYINFGNLEIAQGELAVLLWNGAAWIKQTITTIVSNVFVRDSKDVPFIQHLLQLKGSQEQEITILAKANGIVVGGLVSWSGQGLTFNISYVIYLINNISFSIPAGTVTLDPADPDFKRTDVIGVNDQGAYVVLKGVADGLNLKPQVDASMLELTYVEIDAGAVTPSINELIIYNENIESVGTSALLAADFNDTTFPKVGAKDVKVTAVQNRGKLMFTLPAPEEVAPYNTLSFFLRLSQNIPTKGKLYAQFYKAGKAISDELALTINSTLTNEYQFIAIAMTDFHFRSDSFDMFQLRYLGANFNGFYLDYLRLEGGIVNPVPTGYSGWYLDAEATDVGVVRQMVRSGENVYFIGKNGLIINRYSHITKGNVIELELPDSVAASAYVYIAYASDANGTGFTMTFNGLLNFIAIKTTTTPIAEPQASDFAGLWKQYAGEVTPGPHYTYVAWCETPDPENTLGFTMTPNITLPYEAILITHTEIAEPTAADFVGLWRPRITATDVYDKWNLLVDDDETPQQAITDNTTVYLKRGKGIALDGYIDESDRQVVNFEATNELSIPESNAAEGFKVKLIANEAQAVGDVCFINSSGKAQLANATTIATASARLICTQSVGADSEATYLIEGIIKITGLSLTAGALIYLSVSGTTGNTITQTAPATADNVVQVLGVALTADTMFFNPSLSQVECK